MSTGQGARGGGERLRRVAGAHEIRGAVQHHDVRPVRPREPPGGRQRMDRDRVGEQLEGGQRGVHRTGGGAEQGEEPDGAV